MAVFFNKTAYLVLLSLAIQTYGFGQLDVVSKSSLFRRQLSAGKEEGLVELKRMIPSIRYDLRYATQQNFTGKRLYPPNSQFSFLRLTAAKGLQSVAEDLSKQGLGIVVWDAYRPYRVTVKFWKLIHDERYVANPSKGSGHNRGIAIDLTLYDLKSGILLDMPTDFDDFSEKAHHGYPNLTPLQIKNREILKYTMEKYHFISFDTEWWHYSWPDPKKYSILDLSFDELSKLDDASEK
ncbi:MAG: hypothetical protein RL131_91 [Bacteroidota bacterium]|jgi:D-alanyl-D-alanine dipeptidase